MLLVCHYLIVLAVVSIPNIILSTFINLINTFEQMMWYCEKSMKSEVRPLTDYGLFNLS